jgi:rhodanese-related sulfurtransferase
MLNPEISPAEYVTLRDRTAGTPESPILLDVREPWEAATASIAGAILIPMGEIPTRAHAELDPDLTYVVFCHHGMRSLSVTMWLRREGFDHVQSLAGGIDAWSRVMDPNVPRY